MDLSRFCTKDASEEGTWMEVMDWDGETSLGAKILVLGPDSTEAMKISDELEKESQKQMAEMFGNVKKGKVAEASIPLQERLVSRALRLTKGWKDLDIEGRDFAFTTPNCQWLYENSPFIRDQVLTFHQKRSNFTKPGSPNSPMPSGIESGSTTPAKGARR